MRIIGACTLCSTINTKNIYINNTYLQPVYEKLADLKIDNVACRMCLICHRRLQQCHQLWQLAEHTEDENEAVLEPKKCLLELSTSELKNVSISSSVDVGEKLEIIVKREPLYDEDNEPATGIVLSQDPTSSEESLQSLKVLKLELSRSSVEDSTCGGVYVHDPTAYKQNDTALETQFVPTSNTRFNTLTRPSFKVDKTLSCNICQRNFTERNNLLVHLRIHTGEKPFSCDICRRKFTRKSQLQVHLRTHTGDKPFSCDICYKKFSHKSSLQTHLPVHTGEKPFSCDICQRKFTSRSSLHMHHRIHTGEKPYSCGICGRKFTVNSQLQTHLKFHRAEKPFSCHICERKFTLNCHLKTHLKTHTDEKPLTCEICQHKFTVKRSLQVHLRTHAILGLTDLYQVGLKRP